MLADLDLLAEAAAEVERLDFVAPEHALHPAPRFALGLRLARQRQWPAAARMMQEAADSEEDPSVAAERRLALALVFVRGGAYPTAVHELGRVESFGATPELRLRGARLRCLAHLYAQDHEIARQCVTAAVQASPAEARERAVDLLNELDLDLQRRGWVGGSLSAVLPGLGQVTGGEPVQGVIAALLNGSWGYGTASLLAEGAAVDATLLVLGFGLRYYIGNIQHGAEAWRASASARRLAASRALVGILAALEPPGRPAAAP